MHRLAISRVAVIPFLFAGCSSSNSGDQPIAPTDAGVDAIEAGSESSTQDAPHHDVPEAGDDDVQDGGLDPRFDMLVAAVEKEREDLGAPGVAVAVLEGGEVTFARGFGSKDPDSAVPVEPTTLFRIGSVTKMMTTTAVLQLVESGAVELDAPMTDYLPGYSFALDDTWAPSIRVSHLLTHQAGILDYIQIDDSPVSDAALETFLFGPFAEGAYLMAPPGRMYNYSNPNFMLAGLLAEKVSGTPYRTLMHDNVFGPLGMDRTFFDPSDVLEDGDYALGDTRHWETDEPLVVHPDTYDNAWAAPAGYAFSSVLDLAKFVQFLRAGNTNVLSDSLRQAMQQPHVSTKEFLDRLSYGYGLMIQQGVFLEEFYDIGIVAHGGAIPGFSADVYYVPSCDLGFITLANTDRAYFQNSLVTALKTLCDLPDPVTPPELTSDPATWDKYVGTFVDPYNVGTLHVTRDGTDLLVEMPLVDQLNIPYDRKLEPVLTDNFRLSIQGVQLPVTFLFDSSGQVEYFRTRSFVARIGESDVGQAQPLLATKGAHALLARIRATREPTLRLLPISLR